MGSNTNSATDREVKYVLDALRIIVRALRVADAGLQHRRGMSAAQMFVLQQLAASPGISLNQLAERVLTHQSSVSVVVKRLVERGLVVRKRSADDARRLELSLTSKGRLAARKAPPAVQNELIAGLRELSPVRRRALGRTLSGIASRIGEGGAVPPMFFENPRGGGDRS
ncbi:MAG: MarR family transcriptional regulator [Thermoanaerobaculia bacterium]